MENKEELVKMSKYEYEKMQERLEKIKKAIGEKRYNIVDMEKITGYSRRTLKRDMAYLRKQGYKITTRRVYCFKEEGEDGKEER